MPVFVGRGLHNLLRKRIPTIIGLGLLLLGVGAGIVLVGQGTGGFLPRAAAGATPKQIRITNVTDTGFTVSFLTDAAAPGYIQYGENTGSLSLQIRDDRDQLTNSAQNYRAHHITVRGLQANTLYYFKIGTGGAALFDNSGQPFQVRLASAPAEVPVARTAYGTVVNEVGNPATGSVVYLSATGGAPASALVKSDGSWAINISTMRTKDGSALLSTPDDLAVQIQVVSGEGATANVATTVGDLDPLSPITLGKGVATGADKTTAATGSATTATTAATAAPATAAGSGAESFVDTLAATTATTSAMGDLFAAGEATQAAPTNMQVRFPLRDNEVVNSVRPELSGAAPPNSYLQIQVHSDVAYNGVVQTATDGTWEWTPPSDLTPGEHTVTVTYTDDQGRQQSVQRTFIVQANTNLPAFVSTPSAKLATPTPTPKPTAMAMAATPVPTVQPIATSTPTPTPRVLATTAPLPVTGANPSGWWLAAIACFSIGVFGWWQQKKRRKQWRSSL